MALEIEAGPYFQLLHSMFREDDSDRDIERSDKVMHWVQQKRTVLARVCSKHELAVIGVVITHWQSYQKCPTRATTEQMIKNRTNPPPSGLLEVLYAYDKQSDGMKYLSYADMDVYLQERIDDYEKVRLINLLETGRNIITAGMPNPKGKDAPQLCGTRDAINFVMDKFQQGVLINDVHADGGLLSAYPTRVQETYDQNVKDKLNGRLYIPTGIPIIDKHMGGLRRKELNGVLGYTGQRKTAVVRTMGYNAAKQGFRVLHLPLESDFQEEMTSYNVMHAHAMKHGGLKMLNRKRYDSGDLTKDEYKAFMTEVVVDFQKRIAPNLVVYDPQGNRTWADVKSIIERENYIHPLDLVIVDYLTLLGDANARDQEAAKIAMIQDAKHMTLNAGGQGFCMVTPVQGNRKGYEDAREHDGAWETTGIAKYSEMDKSLDNCFYVFTNDEISEKGEIKLGTCKHRRGPNIPSSFVPLDPNAGMLGTSSKPGAAGETELLGLQEVVAMATVEKTSQSKEAFFDYMAHR